MSIAVVPKCQWRANTSSLAIGSVSLAKFQDFTSHVEEKQVFDWTQDDQSLNIWLKTDVFHIVATYLSSGRTSLLQDSPKTWVVAGYKRGQKKNKLVCIAASNLCITVSNTYQFVYQSVKVEIL